MKNKMSDKDSRYLKELNLRLEVEADATGYLLKMTKENRNEGAI